MNVFITGAAGLIGGRLASTLTVEHRLRLGDVCPIDDDRYVPLDITDLAGTQQAIRGADAVIHLAKAAGHTAEYEADDFNQQQFDINVKGTWNVLEAARRERVRRLVFASSLTVVWGYPPPQTVPSDAAPRSESTYPLTKQLGEVMCRHFSRAHGLSIVCLRIPKPIDLEDQRLRGCRIRPQWIAFPDLLEAFRLAVTVEGIGFELVTIVGESSRRRWDLSKAEKVLGYQPRYRLEDLGYTLGDEREPYPSPEP